jgi:hypothetical protein
MLDLASAARILERGKVLNQFLDRHCRPPFVDEGRTSTPRQTVKSHLPISCVAPDGIAARYGMHTADLVAMQLEYPRQRTTQ